MMRYGYMVRPSARGAHHQGMIQPRQRGPLHKVRQQARVCTGSPRTRVPFSGVRKCRGVGRESDEASGPSRCSMRAQGGHRHRVTPPAHSRLRLVRHWPVQSHS